MGGGNSNAKAEAGSATVRLSTTTDDDANKSIAHRRVELLTAALANKAKD